MLQGLLSPSMELLSTMDNNLAASHVWSLANQPDPNYQAAAMEAILSQATLGLISEHQSLVNYGMLNDPSIIEGMDETQFLPQSSCANPDISSSSATTSCSLGLDHKPLNAYSKHSSKPCNMMLSFPHDLSNGLAGMYAVSASKRRSWQEALSSPPRADHYNRNIVNPNERELSPPAPHILYSVNDPKVSIASLAYPCTIVEKTQESEYPSYINHTGMGRATHIDPLINTRANHMQESMNSAGLCADDHGTCMGDTANKDIMQMGGCAKWKAGVEVSANQGNLSNGSHEIKDVISTHEYINMTHGSSYKGIECHDDAGHLILYKAKSSHDDRKERDHGIALSSKPSIPFADHQSRKRPAGIAHLSSSTSYSKRAHLQNKPVGACSTTTTTTTTTTSTTTRSSKSSSRNPQGPALNTNGKPRALQGSANDPQSLAARNRRERINARLKVLQELVPNGSKVDLVTMLEKAINYVKFLQLQLRVLSNDDYWQANQENVQQATTRSEEGYSAHLNAACDSMIACSDNIGENQYNYMCDKIYNT